MLLRDLTIANICVQPDCQTSLRPDRRSWEGKTGWPAASKAVLSAPGRGFVHAIRQVPSEIRKIEKNRFRKAAATDSAISRTETYCLTPKLLLPSTRLPKIGSRRKRRSQLFFGSPGRLPILYHGACVVRNPDSPRRVPNQGSATSRVQPFDIIGKHPST